MKIIINGLWSKLTVEESSDSSIELTSANSSAQVSEIYIVSLLKYDQGIFAKPSSKKLEIDLSRQTNESAEITEVKSYILSRLESDSVFLDAQFRFDKLELANDLLHYLRSNQENIQEMQDLYARAVALESGLFNYPIGWLGKLVIDCRRKVDTHFNDEYRIHLQAVAEYPMG